MRDSGGTFHIAFAPVSVVQISPIRSIELIPGVPTFTTTSPHVGLIQGGSARYDR